MRKAVLCCSVLAIVAIVRPAMAQLPPVVAPPENPITEPKRVLGKMLFWDVQLSSDNTIACATCHQPFVGGGDPGLHINPGPDGVFGNDDDIFGSLGVARSMSSGHYEPDPIFGFEPQVTGRAANPFIMAMFAPELFWDGRATSEFRDPETDAVLIPFGGALESQAAGPILSSVEMAHAGRSWPEVNAKIAAVRPLALATDLPPDIAAALAVDPTYPDLFEAAFGDPAVTAARIAFAIATYERTLVPDQTPWDLFIAGDPDAMTPQEQNGWDIFLSGPSTCLTCHLPPEFTDHSFRNIGVRPWDEDPGRMDVTGDFLDRGKFKVPTIRNNRLRNSLMHNGQIVDLADAMDFYRQVNGHVQFPENRDPALDAINLTDEETADLVAFLENGLTDPRVEAETFPFDRPTLHNELDPNPAVLDGGRAGSGGFVPQMIATSPPNVGNADFRIGVHQALAGAEAFVAWSSDPADADGELTPDQMFGPITLSGTAAPGDGYGTWLWPIPDDVALLGDNVFLQWRIIDPGAEGGVALSNVAHLHFYVDDPNECSCAGDFNCDQTINSVDLASLLDSWGNLGGEQDVNGDGVVGPPDLAFVLDNWGDCK